MLNKLHLLVALVDGVTALPIVIASATGPGVGADAESGIKPVALQ